MADKYLGDDYNRDIDLDEETAGITEENILPEGCDKHWTNNPFFTKLFPQSTIDLSETFLQLHDLRKNEGKKSRRRRRNKKKGYPKFDLSNKDIDRIVDDFETIIETKMGLGCNSSKFNWHRFN